MENENKLFLSIPGLMGIEIQGKFKVDLDEIKILAQTYLPCVEIGQSSFEDTVKVKYVEGEKRGIEIISGTYYIHDNWNGKISLDLWHFLYSIVRLKLLEKGLYSVHSVCVGKEDHVMLIGHSGSGKSSVLLKLINDFGWKVYSGNKTVVSITDNKIEAVMGTKSISLRSKNANKYPNIFTSSVDYQARTTFSLDKKHYSDEKNVNVSTIYIVRLNDGVEEKEVLSFPSSMHILYPYFLDTVNADTIMCEGRELLMGTPTEGCQLALVQKLKNILKQIKVIRISGSMKYITRCIADK